MYKKAITFWILAVVVGLAACGGGGDHAVSERELPTLSVAVEAVPASTWSTDFEAVGTVRSVASATLSAKMVGHIQAIRVAAGDRVRTGQVLVVIDSRDAAVQLDQADAGLAQAQAALPEVEQAILAGESAERAAQANADLAATTFQRFQALLNRKSVSQQEFDEVQARYTAAQAELSRAQEMLEAARAKRPQVEAQIAQAQAGIAGARLMQGYATLTAPFSGIVTAKLAEVGQLAAPGVPLLQLEDAGHYRLEAVIEESKIGSITPGALIPVEIGVLPEPVEGKVTEIVPAADPASRTFVVKLSLPAVDGLRSGMFGRARFPVGRQEVITVPRSAVVYRGQLTAVFVVDSDSKARFRLVKLGKSVGDRVEVLAGVEVGAPVVVNPAQVQDGSPVSSTHSEVNEAGEKAEAQFASQWNAATQSVGVAS